MSGRTDEYVEIAAAFLRVSRGWEQPLSVSEAEQLASVVMSVEPVRVGGTPTATATGVMRLRRSERDICVCCDGPHVYSRYIEDIDHHRWLEDALRLINENGAVVQITVSALSNPTPDQGSS